MPRPRKYNNDAERQQAYRTRQQAIKENRELEEVPDASQLANMASIRRWRFLLNRAETAINMLQDEMQTYYDERSEQWQESDKGEAHTEQLSEIENLLQTIETMRQIETNGTGLFTQ